ncbi:MAG TPA: chorismate synthase [Bacillota bacterium]|nr:chorismate synthase [Bacillota bacterium]
MRSENKNEFIKTESCFGKNIKVKIFGGSHEDSVGVTITGLPEGTNIDMTELQKFLARRAPGNSPFTTRRKEDDKPVVISGAFTGKTSKLMEDVVSISKEPLTVIIKNTDVRSDDYKSISDIPRPGHADFTARIKYGEKVNMAGGGPFSGRMTAPLCIAGGIAMQILSSGGIEIAAHLSSVNNIYDDPFEPAKVTAGDLKAFRKKNEQLSEFPVINSKAGEKMKDLILDAKNQNDSLGGIVEVCAAGVPAGLGGFMYDGVESTLAPLLFGIPAVKGVEFGTGFASSFLKGSENNDAFYVEKGNIYTLTNHHGGILGGITSGMPLMIRAAFKPTPSISKEQDSVNMRTLGPEKIITKGRHDPCIAVRAVPVTEAAVAIGLLDLMSEMPEYDMEGNDEFR